MSREHSVRGPRAGAALVAVVLLTLALFAVAHGMLALSLGELAASHASARLVEASAAADGAVHAVVAERGTGWLDSIPVGISSVVGTRTFGRAVGTGTLRRLAPEVWWVEGEGRRGTATDRAARLAWALDPLERVLELRGAVSVALDAPVALAGTVDVATPANAESPLTSGDCAPWNGALAAHYAAWPLPTVAAFHGPDTLPRLGRVDFNDLLAAAEMDVAGAGVPAPVEVGGVCVDSDPWNWGDPEHRWRPCGDLVVMRRSLGALRVDGGAGQAVLVVDGDLTLGSGSRLFGLVIASGALRMESGAELVGMALAAGGVTIDSGARVQASACWAVLALAAQRATLGRLRPLPGMSTIGPLG
jgi:hypothetical protein